MNKKMVICTLNLHFTDFLTFAPTQLKNPEPTPDIISHTHCSNRTSSRKSLYNVLYAGIVPVEKTFEYRPDLKVCTLSWSQSLYASKYFEGDGLSPKVFSFEIIPVRGSFIHYHQPHNLARQLLKRRIFVVLIKYIVCS